jgi:hypothetical protein
MTVKPSFRRKLTTYSCPEGFLAMLHIVAVESDHVTRILLLDGTWELASTERENPGATCADWAKQFRYSQGYLSYFSIQLCINGFLNIPMGACWNENATTFLTLSMGVDRESRGKPSLIRILMRPTSSPGFQWF